MLQCFCCVLEQPITREKFRELGNLSLSRNRYSRRKEQ